MIEIKKGINSFYVGDSDEKPLAELTFVNSGKDLVIAEHTIISNELSGQGVGKLLLKEFIDWARLENKKIKPVCPFVKAQMEKNQEYNDMIYIEEL